MSEERLNRALCSLAIGLFYTFELTQINNANVKLKEGNHIYGYPLVGVLFGLEVGGKLSLTSRHPKATYLFVNKSL